MTKLDRTSNREGERGREKKEIVRKKKRRKETSGKIE
jgi:hypothetical protein